MAQELILLLGPMLRETVLFRAKLISSENFVSTRHHRAERSRGRGHRRTSIALTLPSRATSQGISSIFQTPFLLRTALRVATKLPSTSCNRKSCFPTRSPSTIILCLSGFVQSQPNLRSPSLPTARMDSFRTNTKTMSQSHGTASPILAQHQQYLCPRSPATYRLEDAMRLCHSHRSLVLRK
jgi:hypothetical protein